MIFLALFVSLPTKASTGRMRVWRSVKALGCATLRDGVYVLPDPADSAALDEVAAQAAEAGGIAEEIKELVERGFGSVDAWCADTPLLGLK